MVSEISKKEYWKEQNENFDFDILYENEDAMFEYARHQQCMQRLSESRWTVGVDTLS